MCRLGAWCVGGREGARKAAPGPFFVWVPEVILGCEATSISYFIRPSVFSSVITVGEREGKDR